mgnify:CR=1 FL=1
MTPHPDISGRPRWQTAGLFIPPLVLLTPFASFLKFQEYPLLSLEVGYLAAALAVLGLALGALIRWGGRAGTALVLSALVVVFADFQFEIRLTYLALGGGAFLVFAWFAGRALLPVFAAAAAVVFLSTLILPAQLKDAEIVLASPEDIRNELPPILHVILDEHIGIEGIESDTEWEKQARADLTAFYLEYGFRLFGGAYANYTETFNSIPNLLNNTLSTEDFEYVTDGADGLSAVKENAYLSTLSDRGYKIRIYQSKYFNFCEAARISLLSCSSYNYTGLGNLDKLTDSPGVRAELILSRFLNRSRIYGLSRSIYQNLAAAGFLKLRRLENNNFAPLASYPFFRLIENDMAEKARGQVFFAHLLIPHRPFMFDSTCEVVLDHPFDNMEIRSEAWLVEYRKAYYEQVACTTKLMRHLFDSLRRSGIFDQTTIIVHGDHGSRIGAKAPVLENWQSLTPSDLRAHYSTLFAVRAPGIKAGYDDRLFSIGRLLDAVVNRNGTDLDPTPDESHQVIVSGNDKGPMEKKPLGDFRLGESKN